MRTRQTKEEFVTNARKYIKMYEDLQSFYKKVYMPTLKEFDGKVYNVRFIKALRAKSAEVNELIYVNERDCDSIEIGVMAAKYAYTDKVSMWVKCPLTYDFRLSVELTENDKTHHAWIANTNESIKDYKDSIKNYNKYMALGEKLEKTIGKWNALPFAFRHSVDVDWMRCALT